MGGVREAGWGRGEGGLSRRPKGLRNLYRLVPNWGEEQGLLLPISQSFHAATPKEAWDLGQKGSLRLSTAGWAGGDSCDWELSRLHSPSSWGEGAPQARSGQSMLHSMHHDTRLRDDLDVLESQTKKSYCPRPGHLMSPLA